MVFLMERAIITICYDYNLEKIAPLRRGKCHSEEIGKKKLHLLNI